MAEFDFVNNRVFDDRFSAFAPQAPQFAPGSSMFQPVYLDTGVKVRENGDVDFGFYAPEAQRVAIIFGVRASQPLEMTKGEDGVWRVTLPYDPLFCGPKAFEFEVDGARVLSPYCPIYYSHFMAINYVEIPDANAPFVLMRDVPHGSVTTEFYWSDAMETWVRCLVYLPPMYHEGGEYPVLYLQHGAGENETSWVYNGRVSHIMDNLIADGKAEPCIVVMNDGMIRKKDESMMTHGSAFADTLIENCIPMIERKYRVKRDKWHRAIAGFSMGSMQASVIGLTHLDTFAYIGVLSGFMRRLGMGSGMDALEHNPHIQVMQDRETFEREIKLYYRAMGSRDFYFESFENDNKMCRELGFDQYQNVVSRVVEGYPHDWAILRILIHDFAQRIFKD